jgi:hypothetical protein
MSASFDHPSLTDWVDQTSADSILKEAEQSAEFAREQKKLAKIEADLSNSINQSEYVLLGNRKFPNLSAQQQRSSMSNQGNNVFKDSAIMIGDGKADNSNCRIEWACGDKYAGQCKQVIFAYMYTYWLI